MNESESKKSKPKKELRCEPKQLELLTKCSGKKDIGEWQKWRSENPGEQIWLQGAELSYGYLEGANLLNAHLEEADVWGTHLEGANLSGAHLEGARLMEAHLERANLTDAHLERTKLWGTYLEGSRLYRTHLEATQLIGGAHLEGANIVEAHLEGANLSGAHLERAGFAAGHLEGADFRVCSLDGLTLFIKCRVDRKTDFRGVGLESCRMDEGTRYLLEYNKRRMNWQDWYISESDKKGLRKKRQLLTFPVRLFWCMSDYGRSTIRILTVFVALAIVFAVVYSAKPDCVMVNGQVGGLRNFLHSLYFSVVAMTTLGFGDIAANPQSSLGQVLVMLQFFCGYFLLGAIVTRLGILFTAGGPAGRFSKKEK